MCACLLQELGYTPDFVQSLGPLLQQVKKDGVKVISNAGGINPESCVASLRAASKKAGVDLSIAMVTGDDLLGEVSRTVHMCTCHIIGWVLKSGEMAKVGVKEMYSGAPFPDKKFTSMNAYLG